MPAVARRPSAAGPRRWHNNRKKSQLLAWIAPFVFIFNQGCLLVGVIMRPVTDKTHISRVKLAYITDAMGAPLVSYVPHQ